MKNLTILEKLYYQDKIDDETFIEYFYYRNDNDLIVKKLVENKIIDINILKTIANSNKIVSNRIKVLIMNKNDYSLYKSKRYIIINVLENIAYIGVDSLESKEDLSKFIKEKYNYKEIKFIKISEKLLDMKLKELLLSNNLENEVNEIDDVPLFITSLLEDAIELNASDIHIEPLEKNIDIRFRINGDLNIFKTINLNYLSEITTRLKVLSNLDIAEKRDIQDGEFKIIMNNRPINFRISIIPTIYGEKIALRILGGKTSNIDINDFEFGIHLSKFRRLINLNTGLVVITGPTGSGKTTTLYSILDYLNRGNKNIMTVEDPVENKIDGITQTQINTKINFGFEKGLRAILRQDPDIIMIGEIRDKDTAINAARAAMTGHLVLSTLHTNNCFDAIDRLIDIGVEPYMVASALKGVISQRLVKILCPSCKEEYISKGYQNNILAINEPINLYRKIGCSNCHKGYIGRKSIYEVLELDNAMKEEIRISKRLKKVDDLILYDLKKQCTELIKKGEIEFEEIYEIGVNIDGE